MHETQKIVEILKNCSMAKRMGFAQVPVCILNDAIIKLRELTAEHQKHRWIPVEERLPDENEYLCFEPTTYMRGLEIAHMTDTVEYRIGYYDGHKWMDKRHDTIKNVMAWKLHEPYQPEKGGAENHSTGVF